MRISHAGRFVFYSIPKTGSESVRRWLDPVSDEVIGTFRQVCDDRPFYSHMRPVEVHEVLISILN